jgi:Xaa-Pro dipeptidase
MITEKLIREIQKALAADKLDGWLLYDFRGSNVIAQRMVGLGDQITTRRWYYYIPATGTPKRIVHAIEAHNLDHLPGEKIVFRSWEDLHHSLLTALKGAKRVAMEYSTENEIPYIAQVDAGTIELIRKLGMEVVSSGDLVQLFEARWTPEQTASHFEAVKRVDETKNDGFRFITENLRAGKKISEYDVQQFMWGVFDQKGITADHPAIVAVNANASDPHYAPTEDRTSVISEGDLVLIDIWGKLKQPGSIYGDITWMGFAGKEVPERYKKIFGILKGAQQRALQLIQQNFQKGEITYGWQADQAARTHIADAGYGDYFLHRLGHSIGQTVHGNGANLDNLETRDRRKLIQHTGFSVEPGIYLQEFGVRSEYDVYIGEDGPVITSPEQTEIVALL